MIDVSWGTMDRTPAAEVANKELCPIKRIILEVCEKHNVRYLGIVGKRRSRSIAWPRQEVYWRAYNETGASLPEIGRALGFRDHTTVMHGVRAYAARNGVQTGLRSRGKYGADIQG